MPQPPPQRTEDRQALLAFVLDTAKRHGATAADALFVSGDATEVRVRLGETEQVKQSRSKGVGLRVFVGDRSATTSSSDLDRAALEDLIARTCKAAGVTAEDTAAGLPERALYADEPLGDLDLYDPSLADLTAERAIELALEAERVARGADPRIVNSEGAEMGWGTGETHYANSLGAYRHLRRGSASLWTTPVARNEDGGMERDYWYTSARHLADLEAPAEVGREAARRTLRRLGARKPATCKVPVIFEWTVASRLLGALAGAITGGAIYRRTSYLAGKLGETIASPRVTITDNPHVRRGAGSKAWDGEGLATAPTTVVRDGVLASYLLDTYSAKKLGLTTTRNASRSLASTPSAAPTNLWMEPGEGTLEALIAQTGRGLLVTELIGFGVNTVTGDYSQGAVGHWIEDGALAYPVAELTIASTLQTIWSTIDGLAGDRDPRRAVSAPSLRIAEMTVAGS
jgi:PmbA protein